MNPAHVLVSVSRRDVAAARRTLQRAERATLSAERRVLLRAANNVRSMSIAALKGRKSKRTGLPAMQPLDKAWRVLAHPKAKMGGVLADKTRWHIVAPNRHARDVDIVPGLQPLLERWEFADQTRAQKLREMVQGWQAQPREYRLAIGRRAGWPRDPLALPPVQRQPLRNFRDGVADYADRHMGEWYEKIWASYARRG
jgi:hypothetical protein